jgi:hypothetical protein
VENCGNTLILRCSGSEHGGTSQFASRLIGEREVLRTSTSRSRRPTEWVASVTRSEHLGVESAVMAAQVEQLPDLAGYLKIASQPQWRRVALAPLARTAKPAARPPAIATGLTRAAARQHGGPAARAGLAGNGLEAGPS